MVTEDVLAAARLLAEEERFGSVATVVEGEPLGLKAVLDVDGALLAGSLPAGLEEAIRADARVLLEREQSRAVAYEDRGVFIETIAPPPELVVFGAVHIAQELARHAQLLGFRVTVVDARPAFTTPERFPGCRVVLGWPETVLADLAVDQRTFIVVLSHDARFEDPVLEWALRGDARYIGAMGSRRTHANRVAKLLASGFSEVQVGRIHGPVGLDLGAEGPGETAISILAEMIHVRYGSGTGLSLRGRHGRIHRQRTEDEGDVA